MNIGTKSWSPAAINGAKVALTGVAGIVLIAAVRRKKLTFLRTLWLMFQVVIGMGEIWQEKRLRKTLNKHVRTTPLLHPVREPLSHEVL